MKGIGIMRKLDSLGRIVVPKELRTTFGIVEKNYVEILGTEDGILIRNPFVKVKYIDNNEHNKTKDEE